MYTQWQKIIQTEPHALRCVCAPTMPPCLADTAQLVQYNKQKTDTDTIHWPCADFSVTNFICVSLDFLSSDSSLILCMKRVQLCHMYPHMGSHQITGLGNMSSFRSLYLSKMGTNWCSVPDPLPWITYLSSYYYPKQPYKSWKLLLCWSGCWNLARCR